MEFYQIPFDDDADEVKTWKGLALSAIMDMRRYADDETSHRRMVSVEAYEADAVRLSVGERNSVTMGEEHWLKKYRGPDGRYAYFNKFDRLCTCGHKLGAHIAGGFECGTDPNGYPETRGCKCVRFWLSRRKPK